MAVQFMRIRKFMMFTLPNLAQKEKENSKLYLSKRSLGRIITLEINERKNIRI